MALKLSLSQSLPHRVSLSQILQSSNLLSMPIGAVDKILEKIAENPERVESILGERKVSSKGNQYVPATERVLFSILGENLPEGDPDKKRGGMILDPPKGSLEDFAGNDDEETTIEPDVLYIGRRGEKPIIKFAPYLRENLGFTLQDIPSKFGSTKSLCRSLLSHREWANSTLREIYSVLGRVQKEYLETLNPGRLHKFIRKDLGDDASINLAETTVWRILQNRYVEIWSAGNQIEVHPVEHLLPTHDHVKRYAAIPNLNEMLASEDMEKSLSDSKLRAGAPSLARRTVSKYREVAGIPNSSERKKIYSQKPLQVFQIPIFND